MFAFFAHSKYIPCPECGASLAGEDPDDHVCDEGRRLDFQMFRMRSNIARFEEDLAEFLETSAGKFERWCAEQQRLAA